MTTNQMSTAEKIVAPSKKSLATNLYNINIAAGKSRKDIIAQFRAELNMSDACATTYFQNCRAAAGVVVARKPAAQPVAEPVAQPVTEQPAEELAAA